MAPLTRCPTCTASLLPALCANASRFACSLSRSAEATTAARCGLSCTCCRQAEAARSTARSVVPPASPPFLRSAMYCAYAAAVACRLRSLWLVMGTRKCSRCASCASPPPPRWRASSSALSSSNTRCALVPPKPNPLQPDTMSSRPAHIALRSVTSATTFTLHWS
eukprot:1215893-Pyramimonas_sp.AAC.1